MKKSLVFAALITLTGCAQTPKNVTRVDYVCPLDTSFSVEFNQQQETATLYDQADRVFVLKLAPAASGAYYQNTDGVSIHSKNNAAIIELVKGKPISCTQWTGS